MVSEEKNQEMSVDEILSSIKEVISNETASITDNSDNEILELTDVVSGEDDSILLDDIDLIKKEVWAKIEQGSKTGYVYYKFLNFDFN
mgnify:CR=1 FL=1